MTNKECVLSVLTNVAICDDCLSDQSGVEPRQTVNIICRELAEASAILRQDGTCTHCRKTKIINKVPDTHSVQNEIAASSTSSTSILQPTTYNPGAPIKFLVGENVYLRPLEPKDAEPLHFYSHNDHEVRRLSGVQIARDLSFIYSYIERVNNDPTRVQFAICREEDDAFIGDIALNDIDNRFNRSANMRIAIFHPYTGKGYGTEAIRLILDYGFGFLNLHRVDLEVYTINPRAVHTYEKIGFVREGVKRKNWYYDHHYYDSIIMSLLEDEYRALYPKKV